MIEEISELEEMVQEEEIKPVADNSALAYSKFAYNAAAVILDVITGWTIWQLTFWYYGVLWVLAGAVVFFLHQKNWERDGNNQKQVDISQRGIIVSVASIVVMGAVAGALWILGVVNLWTEVGIIVSSVLLFSWHAVQLATYYFIDDEFVIRRQVARAEAQAKKKIKIIKAGGEVVKANKEALDERNAQYKKHGNKGAVDAAINRVEGKKPQGNNQGNQGAPNSPNAPHNPTEAITASPNGSGNKEKNFTQGGKQ